ncbi:MAG: adenylate/guanylate cyclase domain-containing protein [Rhodobiaceae bacterium]|nr:adenylate/guanylate cyclase domain-containing protein [Rhodobiaceae bacterium]MCC0013582.1 adenylate/guanylate cyclase domain-containing protein [Rhodobiaceae bacterium]MCC0018304.1 adenylate/guanylate cyclase domain-containing protein [Rhodobiaceae bacterium]MCC0060623.1 adenylate/guanylate cyclase domain-containing protein [Rhodobiaceae bacterium]
MTVVSAGPDVKAQGPGNLGLVRRVVLTFLASVLTQLTGSAFNIWYNLTQIRPLLTQGQAARFETAVNLFNIAIYPLALLLSFLVIWSLVKAVRSHARQSDPDMWHKAQRRAVNLPWLILAIAGPAWLLTIPALLFALYTHPEPLDPRVPFQLVVSVVVSAAIALTHLFFVIELVGQRLWFPVFFDNEQPSSVSGTLPLTLPRRGIFFAVSAVACPIISLLLIAAPSEMFSLKSAAFPLMVGTLGIAFGMLSAWMLGRIIGEPIARLRASAERVEAGDLGPDTEIDLLRADEFGHLIGGFNRMVAGLREKQHVEEVLGRHVDQTVARILLNEPETLGGTEREISVMFTDIRGFTTRCGTCPPNEVVDMLNLFHGVMVPLIEAENGIINEFTGDGFMAIFGATGTGVPHADNAVAAGKAMLASLPRLNRQLEDRGLEPIAIGVGINTGPAIVGAIGAPRRSSFSAVGNMVPVAARIEGLTKEAGHRMLFSDTTMAALTDPPAVISLDPRPIRGRDEPVRLYALVSAD